MKEKQFCNKDIVRERNEKKKCRNTEKTVQTE